MLIQTQKQIDDLRQAFFQNAEKAKKEMIAYADHSSALQLFAAIKFDKLGLDPITGRKLNLIEQINQMYSDLVVLAAAEHLLRCYPGKTFALHMGPASGYDIESTDGQIAAECFAVTGIASNDKLRKDCEKLLASEAAHKYIFFYAHQISEKALSNRKNQYPQIHFQRICSLDG